MMKTLDDIKKEVEDLEKTLETDKEKSIIEEYKNKFTQEIGDDRNKLLLYKNACSQVSDLNFSTFWMSTLAVLIALLSIIINSATHTCFENVVICGAIILLLLLTAAYYHCAYTKKKKYSIIMLVLDDIEKKMDKYL